MIQEKQILNKVLGEGETQSTIGMSLDMESAAVLMQMLSKNLYSDPIGSTVRECASNALDSHRRAGSSEAIIVSLKINDQNNYEFTVEDFGTGLDADDVENIISKYGKSTKRNSNVELGMMGLGFKAPLSYASSFYFVCRKNGVERKYMMYEGEEVNTIDLLYEAPTDKPNGVKVIVPVKYNDRNNFWIKIKNQLAYFESVYFDVNVHNDIITNNFNIHRAEHFQISEMNNDMFMHICLDNVYYPLDCTKLGIPQLKIPIGLRFSLTDGLFPTPNREQLIYSSAAIKTIKDKIALVSDVLIRKYNEKALVCDNLQDMFNHYASQVRNVTVANLTIDVSLLSLYGKEVIKKPIYTKYPKTNFASLYRNRDSMFYEYKNLMCFYRNKFKQNKNSWDMGVKYSQFTTPKANMLYSEKFVGNKKSYVKSLLPQNSWNSINFVKKVRNFSLYNKDKNNLMDNYYDLLSLGNHPKKHWRAIITEFQDIIKDVMQDVEDVDAIDIPQDWLNARKKKRVSVAKGGVKRVKVHGEISCRVTEELQRYVHGKNSKFTPTLLKIEDIESSPFLNVYGRQKDETTIDELYSISSKQKIKYFVLSEREYKVAQTLDFHNFISIEKFMEAKTKPFKRLVTSYVVLNLMNQYRNTFNKYEMLQGISKSLHDHLDYLAKYVQTNYYRNGDEHIYKSMLAVAEQHNLFDETIYSEYKHIKELLDNFPFIETAMDVLPYNSGKEGQERYAHILADLFKYHRIRIDYTNYKLTLNEDCTETLDEETLEQLTQNN